MPTKNLYPSAPIERLTNIEERLQKNILYRKPQ